MTQTVSPSTVRVLKRLGSHISLARRRRRWSQKDMAEQIGASVSTVRRLESGDPGIALQHLVGVMVAFGEMDQLNNLLDTSRDTVGLLLQDGELPKRVRARSSNER
jgi:transcriptional regulator with XRE-family HTH domain